MSEVFPPEEMEVFCMAACHSIHLEEGSGSLWHHQNGLPAASFQTHAHIAPAAGTAGSWQLTSESLFRYLLLPKNLISLLGAACRQNLVNIGDKVPRI